LNVAETVGWVNACLDTDLAKACATKVHTDLQPTSGDANSWEPVPKTICDILKLPEGAVQQE